MTYFDRHLDLRQEAEKRSLFLLGPRQVGKTSLLKKLFPRAHRYDLLLSDLFLRMTQRPALIRESEDLPVLLGRGWRKSSEAEKGLQRSLQALDFLGADEEI